MNEVQVEEREHLTPAELVRRWSEMWPKALKGRKRFPPFMLAIPLEFGPPIGKRPMGTPHRSPRAQRPPSAGSPTSGRQPLALTHGPFLHGDCAPARLALADDYKSGLEKELATVG
jgi:hypothetical protein